MRGAVGVEVYNNVCRLLNGKGTALAHWDALLEDGQRVWGVASDDVHFRPRHGFGGDAWIMVRAEANTAQDILAAIKAGAFYASTGPDILDMQRDSQRLYVRTSPAASITFRARPGAASSCAPPKARRRSPMRNTTSQMGSTSASPSPTPVAAWRGASRSFSLNRGPGPACRPNAGSAARP
ncbi:MAG: hypothetical protein M5R40_24630 [Anaerolineae bacterium]|nr:hypothetical protein [Anaerolineae bacterium]